MLIQGMIAQRPLNSFEVPFHGEGFKTEFEFRTYAESGKITSIITVSFVGKKETDFPKNAAKFSECVRFSFANIEGGKEENLFSSFVANSLVQKEKLSPRNFLDKLWDQIYECLEPDFELRFREIEAPVLDDYRNVKVES